jgi:hypothetical protein
MRLLMIRHSYDSEPLTRFILRRLGTRKPGLESDCPSSLGVTGVLFLPGEALSIGRCNREDPP